MSLANGRIFRLASLACHLGISHTTKIKNVGSMLASKRFEMLHFHQLADQSLSFWLK